MDPKEIARAFAFASPVTAVTACKRGHINHTYFIDCVGGERYVLQHLNRVVFPDPAAVMSNVVGVTAHIRRKLLLAGEDPTDRVLSFVPAGDKYFFVDESGEYWRAYRFVTGVCPEHCAVPADFARVGRAFGVFQRQLADYDAATLFEVIPDFHNTPRRYEALLAAVEADVFGRVPNAAQRSDLPVRGRPITVLLPPAFGRGNSPCGSHTTIPNSTTSSLTPKPERGVV